MRRSIQLFGDGLYNLSLVYDNGEFYFDKYVTIDGNTWADNTRYDLHVNILQTITNLINVFETLLSILTNTNGIKIDIEKKINLNNELSITFNNETVKLNSYRNLFEAYYNENTLKRNIEALRSLLNELTKEKLTESPINDIPSSNIEMDELLKHLKNFEIVYEDEDIILFKRKK